MENNNENLQLLSASRALKTLDNQLLNCYTMESKEEIIAEIYRVRQKMWALIKDFDFSIIEPKK